MASNPQDEQHERAWLERRGQETRAMATASHRYRTSRALPGLGWGPNHTPLSAYKVDVPAGHPVTYHGTDAHGQVYFAQPTGLVDRQASPIEWHDAVHYGIRVPADAVVCDCHLCRMIDAATEPQGGSGTAHGH